VTDFEFRLNPLGPQVMAGPVFWPMEDAPEVLRFYGTGSPTALTSS
jgi:hypothetical protein